MSVYLYGRHRESEIIFVRLLLNLCMLSNPITKLVIEKQYRLFSFFF